MSIPSLGVTAPVIPIAAAAGTLEPPNDPYVWGWWNDGADAGAAVGSALITGHTVHNGPAPMNNLDTIKLGAKVNVHDHPGRHSVSRDHGPHLPEGEPGPVRGHGVQSDRSGQAGPGHLR